SLSTRLTARLLSETLRRLSPGGRMLLIPPSGFWDGLGRKLGASTLPLQKVQDLVDVCETERFAEVLPHFWEQGFNAERVYRAVWDYLERNEPQDADGFLRRMIYCGMARTVMLGSHEELEDFLTGSFRESPEYVVGAGDLTKRLLRVLLEVFAAFHVPVVVA